MDHVVEQRAGAAHRVLPEDRVTDATIGPGRGEQRFELRTKARRVKMPPRDRRKARVPIPLPALAPRTRAGVGEPHAITLAGDPTRFEYLLATLAERGHRGSFANRARGPRVFRVTR